MNKNILTWHPVALDLRGEELGPESTNSLYVMKDSNAPSDWDWDLKYSKYGDVGLDLPVLVNDIRFIKGYEGRVENRKWFDLPPGSTAEIPTGLRVKVPNDAWGNIRARSSTGFKHGLIVLEGVIDSGYTGPLYALTHNPTAQAVRITEGMRLAQLVLIPKYSLQRIIKVDKLYETDRGETGFGSSGS